MTNYHLNQALPQLMWIDLNSAFATIEQQAHPSLRHRPVGISNRVTGNCCIITASYEARALGVHTGMRRREALSLCPELIILESDSAKYSAVYHQLFDIMQDYSPVCDMKSIDEGYIDLQHTAYDSVDKLRQLGVTIKQRVRNEIGDYMTINVGLGSNRFLAKLAAGLHKPNGLDVITPDNLTDVYGQLELEDLTGIAGQLGRRLRRHGINTPLDFLAADEPFLRQVIFHSICGTYWYRRLRGYEVDDYQTNLSTIGRQWVVDKNGDDEEYLSACLHYLAECVGTKLRYRQVQARGVCLWLRLQSGDYYHRKFLSPSPFDSNQAIWQIVQPLFQGRPSGRIICLGLYVYNFVKPNPAQLSLVSDINRASNLIRAIDQINQTYGTATIHSAHSTTGAQQIHQKVPFGGTNYFDLLIE